MFLQDHIVSNSRTKTFIIKLSLSLHNMGLATLKQMFFMKMFFIFVAKFFFSISQVVCEL